MNTFWAIIILILLLALNAYFVAGEFALVSSRKDRLENFLEEGHHRAKTVIDASEHLSMMLATCQLGITIASVLIGKISEPAVASLLEVPLKAIHVEGVWLHSISFIVALSIVSYLHILLGEMVPKNLTIAGPERISLVIVPSLVFLTKISKPLLVFFNHLANGTLRIFFRIEPRDELERNVTAVQLKSMIGDSAGEGLMAQEEIIRLDRAIEASDRAVHAVMIPVQRMRSIRLVNETIPIVELRKMVEETGYSRYPVLSKTGNYLGFLHVKDVISYLMNDYAEETTIPANVIRPLITFPSDATIDSVSARMRRARSHLALVAHADNDEIIGFVALEDLMEEFVGTVRDSTHRIPE